MSDVIPEDIRKLADLLARREEERQFGRNKNGLAADIAKALMAERESAALLAEGRGRNVVWTPAEIAAAIRKGGKS